MNRGKKKTEKFIYFQDSSEVNQESFVFISSTILEDIFIVIKCRLVTTTTE